MRQVTTFRFAKAVDMDDVESSLFLARLAAISLHGADRVELQADAQVDPTRHTCTISTTHRAGQTLALIFAGYVRREFGSGVKIERVARLTESGKAVLS